MPAGLIRVALVDDQNLVVDGFSAILGGAGDIDVVCACSHGGELLAAVNGGLAVDLVLLDIQMPGLDGIETTRRLKAAQVNCKVLILTTFDDAPLVQQALEAGADGYILKRCTSTELLAAVRTVHAGGAALGSTIAQQVLSVWRNGGASRAGEGRAAPTFVDALTPRELEVFQLIGRGLSNEEIASELFLSTGTVKKHVGAILSKSGERDRVNLALAAQRTQSAPD